MNTLLYDKLGFMEGDFDDSDTLRDLGVNSLTLKGGLEEICKKSGKTVKLELISDSMSMRDLKNVLLEQFR